MSLDTQVQNKKRIDLDKLEQIWLFGYGSLIYKVDFPILTQHDAFIKGWERRFWQGSHDHRGTPDNPGRVLTLTESPGATCQGIAYQVSLDIFDYLDHREKNGYLRHLVTIYLADQSVEGVIYIADQTNAAFLGPASEQDIAAHIARSSGPSGPNTEYIMKLAESLRSKGFHDDHVFAIEKALVAI